MELIFPIEFFVLGTALSFQAKRAKALQEWKDRLRAASREVLPDNHFATDGLISVTLSYFPETRMTADIDNIVKPILDAFCNHIYLDDAQVERIVVQKFEPEMPVVFDAPSQTLSDALEAERPVLYIRISNDPFEDMGQ